MGLSVLGKLCKMIKHVHSIQSSSNSEKRKCEKLKTRLRDSLGIIVALIERGDENLWPIFDKLEDELKRVEGRELRLSRYSNFQ